MRQLYPSFANPDTWRTSIREKLTREQWKEIRQKILERDGHTCQYCGFKTEKWQICHHVDGNPNNNREENLVIICQMCNLVEHAGFGCIVQGIVDLYKKSRYSQNEVITKTRELRALGKKDVEIIEYLGLEEKTGFVQDLNYLKPLFGFVSSRKAVDAKLNIALEYQYNAAPTETTRRLDEY